MTAPRDAAERCMATATLILSLLAGIPSQEQGAILAELLAVWLAGHHVEGDTVATLAMRARLLEAHCAAVQYLVKPNAYLIGTTPDA